MKFAEIAERVGVSTYPEKFDKVYESGFWKDTAFCSEQLFEKYQGEYDFCGEYQEVVREGLREIKEDSDLYTYGSVICEYIKTSTSFEARHVPMPPIDETRKRDMFAVLVMLTLFPMCEELYLSHGYTKAAIQPVLRKVYGTLNNHNNDFGRPAMTMGMYNWYLIFIYAEMFDHDCFNYQFRAFYGGAIILKNKKTGEFVPMMIENTFHRNGLVLGSGGADDAEGSFTAQYQETDDAYIGNLVYYGRVEKDPTVCRKSEWECVLRPDDEVLAVHIPRGTDISHDKFIKSFQGGVAYAKKTFPERKIKFLVCFSWMMDPDLRKLLPPESKLMGFKNAFVSYPLMSTGSEAKHWVFPGCKCEISELPEETSLQRNLKKMMLGGDFLHYTAGVCTEVLI